MPELQQNLPFDQKPHEPTSDTMPVIANSEQTSSKIETQSTAKIDSVTNVEQSRKAENQEQESDAVDSIKANRQTKPIEKSPSNLTKKLTTKGPAKNKKLARQVKKANNLSGKASAPMKKVETITSVKEIPTNAMANSERMELKLSGRTAVLSDVINRNSAGPTKP